MKRFIWATTLMAAVCLPSAAPAQAAPSAPKVLRYAMLAAETGFDPVQVSDLYSRAVLENIFESLLTYDYLARPVQLRPQTAQSLPEVNDQFTVFTFRIRPGIFFSDDPAFGGKPRELVAQDYVYSLKRIFDPRWKSPLYPSLETVQIVGMDALRAAAIRNKGKFDYDSKVEGLDAPDRYTLRIKLAKPSPRFVYAFTSGSAAGAVAREVVERYGDDIMAHPVGTGPFRLQRWQRGAKIELERNPSFREQRFDSVAAADDAPGQEIARALSGKKLPIIDRVEVSIIEQAQPRWLSFMNGSSDVATVPLEFANTTLPGGKLAPSLAKRNMQMQQINLPDIVLTYFNMQHPIIGGYAPDKVALRRAITLSYDVDEELRLVRRMLGVKAQSFVAPLTTGYDPALRTEMGEHSVARAKALLDTYSYIDRDGDGWRETPSGAPLTLEFLSVADQTGRQFDELWRRSLARIGVRTSFSAGLWSAQNAKARAGNFMVWFAGWSAGTPDAETFFDLADGAQIGGANLSRFDLPAYNALYQQQTTMPDGAARDTALRDANKLLIAYMPMKLHVHRKSAFLAQPWVIGYRVNPFSQSDYWRYIDIDQAQQHAQAQKGASRNP